MAGGGGGEGAESGGGRLGEERTHGPRLPQKSFHGGQLRSAVMGVRRYSFATKQ